MTDAQEVQSQWTPQDLELEKLLHKQTTVSGINPDRLRINQNETFIKTMTDAIAPDGRR